MKRAVWLLALMFLLMGTLAQAKLLGISQYEGNRPDIYFDVSGSISYDATTDLFEFVNVFDRYITLRDGSQVYLTDLINYTRFTGMGLAVYIDESGNLSGGVNDHTFTWSYNVNGNVKTWSYTSYEDYDMVEVLLEGSVTINGITFDASNGPILLLGANIKSFGWGEPSAPGVEDAQHFDFVFTPVAGALVDAGIWPTSPDTGAIVYTAAWSGDWTQDQTINNVKGDKMPTPEPATMLLVGAGLLGVGFVGRRRLKK